MLNKLVMLMVFSLSLLFSQTIVVNKDNPLNPKQDNVKPLPVVKKTNVKKDKNVLMDMNLNILVKRINPISIKGKYETAMVVIRRNHTNYGIEICDISFRKPLKQLGPKNQWTYQVAMSTVQDLYDMLTVIGNDDITHCVASKLNNLVTFGLLRVK